MYHFNPCFYYPNRHGTEKPRLHRIKLKADEAKFHRLLAHFSGNSKWILSKTFKTDGDVITDKNKSNCDYSLLNDDHTRIFNHIIFSLHTDIFSIEGFLKPFSQNTVPLPCLDKVNAFSWW
jgi:hypothetical protein